MGRAIHDFMVLDTKMPFRGRLYCPKSLAPVRHDTDKTGIARIMTGLMSAVHSVTSIKSDLLPSERRSGSQALLLPLFGSFP